MTHSTQQISDPFVANFAASAASLHPEAHGVRLTGDTLEIWTADAPADAVQAAIGHVEVVMVAHQARADGHSAVAHCEARLVSLRALLPAA